jgi:hypothetical protein
MGSSTAIALSGLPSRSELCRRSQNEKDNYADQQTHTEPPSFLICTRGSRTCAISGAGKCSTAQIRQSSMSSRNRDGVARRAAAIAGAVLALVPAVEQNCGDQAGATELWTSGSGGGGDPPRKDMRRKLVSKVIVDRRMAVEQSIPHGSVDHVSHEFGVGSRFHFASLNSAQDEIGERLAPAGDEVLPECIGKVIV